MIGSQSGSGFSGNLADDMILPKTSGKGIKVDNAIPTFGWRDLKGIIAPRGLANTAPSAATYIGNIKQYQFSINDDTEAEFHVPHDYLPGSDIYIHTHWSHNVTTVTGGSITWGFEVSYSKGHNQTPFSAVVSPTVVGNASTTQYQHIITEVQLSAASPSASQIDTDDIEVDGIILVLCKVSANNITVSGGGVPEPFIHYIDIHYQSTNMPTKQKAPDFYV